MLSPGKRNNAQRSVSFSSNAGVSLTSVGRSTSSVTSPMITPIDDTEGSFIKNYSAQFNPEDFHTSNITAIDSFEVPNFPNFSGKSGKASKTIVVTGSATGEVRLCDAFRGQLLEGGPSHTGAVKSIVHYHSHNTTLLITGSEDCKVKIWDYRKKELLTTYERKSKVLCLAICEKTGLLAVGTTDQKIAIYKLKGSSLNDQPLADFKSLHSDLILALGIVASTSVVDQARIVSVGWDKRMFVWKSNGAKDDFDSLSDHQVTSNNSKPESMFERGHTKSITALTIHVPCGEGVNPMDATALLFTGSLDKTIIVWDFETRKRIRILEGHEGQVNAIRVYDQDGDGSPPIVLSVSDDKKLILWDLFTGHPIRTISCASKLSNLALLSSMDGIIAISAVTPGFLMWDLRRTSRTRRFLTGDVTTIEVYTPPPSFACDIQDQLPQVLIGSVDSWFKIFAYDEQTNVISQPLTTAKYHDKRINDGRIFVPAPDSLRPNEIEVPLMMSADGNGNIVVWKFKIQAGESPSTNLERTLVTGEPMILTIDIYDPDRYGRDRDFQQHRTGKIANGKVNLGIPCLISGGGGKSIKIWDFLGLCEGLSNTTPHLIAEIPKAHANNIRSIVIHHPVSKDEDPLFVTGSYDMTTKLWKLETLELLHEFQPVHTNYVFATAIYDPNTHYAAPENPRPAVITCSYDGSFAIHDMRTKEVLVHKRDAHKDSITALAVYTPPYGNKDESALIVTGSIDCLVHIWNMRGEKIQTLYGHKNRVCTIKVYIPLGKKHPVILSGDDDGVTIVWEDSLYQYSFMPLREMVTNAFELDLMDNKGDWPNITSYVKQYDSMIFIENSHLFTLAVLHHRPDFLIKFWKYLSLTLPVIQPHQEEGINYDLLSLAIKQHNMACIRSIVLSWIERLNEDMDNMLMQRYYHSSYLFPMEALEQLYQHHPLQFIEFICSLRLIRCDKSLMKGIIHLRYFPSDRLYEYYGAIQRVNYYDKTWMSSSSVPSPQSTLTSSLLAASSSSSLRLSLDTINDIGPTSVSPPTPITPKMREATGRRWLYAGLSSRATDVVPHSFSPLAWFNRFLKRLDSCLLWMMEEYRRLFRITMEAQPVTCMMLPIRECGKVHEYLEKFLHASDQCNKNVEIFNSPAGIHLLQYYWQIRGRSAHTISFLKFLFFTALFCVVTFFSPSSHNSGSSYYHDYPGLVFLSCLCLVGFLIYGYEEYRQMTFIQVRRRAMMSSSSADISLTRIGSLLLHFSDMWNTVDFIIVVTGCVGLVLRLVYANDTDVGKTFLALTAVFLWCKLLYFLRPYSSTGPLVAMILRIASMIKAFLLVLFCVLTGFAQAFWLLSKQDPNLTFGTIPKAFFHTFLYMLGQNVGDDYSETASPIIASFLIVIFLLVMMVLMLNLLIALMGDEFTKVRALELALWRSEQAKIILDNYPDRSSLSSYLLVLTVNSEVKNSPINCKEELQKLITTTDVLPFTPLPEPKVESH
eukprot:gene15180-16949_t